MKRYFEKYEIRRLRFSFYLSCIGIIVALIIKYFLGFESILLMDLLVLSYVFVSLVITKNKGAMRALYLITYVYVIYLVLGSMLTGFEYKDGITDLFGGLTYIIPGIFFFMGQKLNVKLTK